MINRTAAASALAVAAALPMILHAQRGRGAAGEKPKVDIVQSVGCADRKSGDAGRGAAGPTDTWFLTRAAEPRVTTAGIFNTTQIEAAKTTSLGTETFQLVGVAEFLSPEDLLRTGRRKEFTTPDNANATAELRAGRKVLVKGLLVPAGDVKRINLLSVIGLADTCN